MKGDYEKSIIYGIKCKTTGQVYIGSTNQGVNTRLSKHKTDYKGHMGIGNNVYRNYRSSFEVLHNDTYSIYVIESYPCKNKYELDYRETQHIIRVRLDPDSDCCNVRLPIRIKNLPLLEVF